jgi:hypothetical protein
MTHHSDPGKCPYKTSDRALVDGRPWGHSTYNHDYQLLQSRKRERRKPYCVQFVLQLFFCTLATNEFFQSLKFLRATRLDSARIVKNVTYMIGEHKFIVDGVLASLTPCSGANEEEYY